MYAGRNECLVIKSYPRSGSNNLSYHTDVCEFTLGWSQLIVDQGLLGTIPLILVLWSLIRGLNGLTKEPGLPQFWSVLSLSLIFVLLCDIVNGIFTYNWVDLQRWFTLGLANLVIIQAHSRADREVYTSNSRDSIEAYKRSGVGSV